MPDLVFIHTADSYSGTVEVVWWLGADLYQGKRRTYTSAFKPSDFPNKYQGVWLLYSFGGDDGTLGLVYIKTSNTPTSKIKLYVASGSSSYSILTFSEPTDFNLENNGTWPLAPFSSKTAVDFAYIKETGTWH
ncbi:hypothetical protein B0J14DRAFT_637617 [Halenospora varia]|nr:hypothetical protein B0J14DRAFT_637617 [Halenospora varia]